MSAPPLQSPSAAHLQVDFAIADRHHFAMPVMNLTTGAVDAVTVMTIIRLLRAQAITASFLARRAGPPWAAGPPTEAWRSAAAPPATPGIWRARPHRRSSA